uniref:Uncharacterized protein n=1 Tax=Octopus bimaculoides TaxID=37653 RepID=A0A0L8HPB2_OCTBM
MFIIVVVAFVCLFSGISPLPLVRELGIFNKVFIFSLALHGECMLCSPVTTFFILFILILFH